MENEIKYHSSSTFNIRIDCDLSRRLHKILNNYKYCISPYGEDWEGEYDYIKENVVDAIIHRLENKFYIHKATFQDWEDGYDFEIKADISNIDNEFKEILDTVLRNMKLACERTFEKVERD